METLNPLNLTSNTKYLIYDCIDSSNMSINWIDARTTPFNATRVICQDESISPYLFVVAIEIFSHKIKDMLDNDTRKPIWFGRGRGPQLSHMCFGYNLVCIA